MIVSKEVFSALSIALGLISCIPYALSIYRHQTKPHMISWLIWAVACGTGASVQLAEGGGAGSWYFMVNTVWCLSIAAIAFRMGSRDIRTYDWLILLIALSAIPLWVVTDNPLISVFIIIGIDGIGYIPTFRKSWTHPEQENALTWFMSCFVFSLSILALEAYSLSTYLYPATFVVINLALTVFLLTRRRILQKVSTA